MRSSPISFRIEPELKAALEKAASEDSRSLSSMVIKILTDWLRQSGHLK